MRKQATGPHVLSQCKTYKKSQSIISKQYFMYRVDLFTVLLTETCSWCLKSGYTWRTITRLIHKYYMPIFIGQFSEWLHLKLSCFSVVVVVFLLPTSSIRLTYNWIHQLYTIRSYKNIKLHFICPSVLQVHPALLKTNWIMCCVCLWIPLALFHHGTVPTYKTHRFTDSRLAS